MAIIYVTRDRERAIGMAENDGYSIISGDGAKDTFELLSSMENTKSDIVVFKNNKQIEDLCKERGLNLLNPSAELAERVENKITQIEWLGDLKTLLPDFTIKKLKDIKELKKIFILQWAHGHTGESTVLVNSQKILDELREKFPERDAKIVEYIKGPMFTINIVVAKDKILLGNISYQITGVLPFTENPFSTIGNDWSLPHTILSENHIKDIEEIANKIGEKMKSSGWKGLFGIDVIYDEERDEIKLIEINARQPASTTFESQLQSKFGTGITIFEAHIKALLGESIDSPIAIINDGAQILQRVTGQVKEIDDTKLIEAGYKTIKYNNKKLNEDLLRIQSEKGVMETHNKFNGRGKEILGLL